MEQKNIIDQQVGLLYTQISNINEQIAAFNLLIADKQDELDEAQAKLNELSEKNKERCLTYADFRVSYRTRPFPAAYRNHFKTR